MIPLYWQVNQEVMTQYEREVVAAVQKGDVVKYRVTPLYHGDDLVPYAVTIEAKGETINFSVSILNRPDPLRPSAPGR